MDRVWQVIHTYSGDVPFLNPSGKELQRSIRKVLQYNFNLTCLSFYLGNMDIELPKEDRYLLKIFMAASKKAITRRWLNTETPTVSQWEAIIKNIQTMELLLVTFSLRLQREKGDALWEKWYSYITRRGDNLP